MCAYACVLIGAFVRMRTYARVCVRIHVRILAYAVRICAYPAYLVRMRCVFVRIHVRICAYAVRICGYPAYLVRIWCVFVRISPVTRPNLGLSSGQRVAPVPR